MINHYPLWKYALILIVLGVGTLYALPNLFGEDPAVQVSASRASINDNLRDRMVGELANEEIEIKESEVSDRLLIRLHSEEDQLKALEVIENALDRQYVTALNLAPATPEWLTFIRALPMYLGLDLRGGVHFLMEVDLAGAVRQAEQSYAGDLRTLLRENKIRQRSILSRSSGGFVIRFQDADNRDRAYELIRARNPELEVTSTDAAEEPVLEVLLGEDARREIESFAVQQNITTLRNRVNELGVAEPVIQRQGGDRIVVQLPGVQDTVRAKEILGATATLEFRMVHEESAGSLASGELPGTGKRYEDRSGVPIILQRNVMLTGEYITDAASGIEQQTGSPAVFITLDGKGARLFSERTRDRIGQTMAVVYIEHKSFTEIVDGERVRQKEIVEEVINTAVIRDQLGKRFQITGLGNTEEARDLALLLRAGALAAPIDIIEERTVGPSLGQANIDQGFRSVVIGFLLVLVLMAIRYRVFGMVANLALTFNLVLVIALLSLLQATLTLPGIAGIVLTVGMAVDANVLIFERIREEIRNGNTPQASIHSGYEKAFSTIADANITTLIAAVLLFGFGTGPIKGFAITLSLGIITSMFTAIMFTRALINLIYGGRRLKTLSIGGQQGRIDGRPA
ncbi:protein translocase subunit SecD [Thioalkalivibrio sp. HK1]|uniref:protein translocase subunit SecD n=1 Tax=Thioalkalivibrio sp. HK1 TaxID=1469245 RepID=UPI0004B8B375|nr:protein translocase subunit SecD [Thioalkalivibrio sp. HK1]